MVLYTLQITCAAKYNAFKIQNVKCKLVLHLESPAVLTNKNLISSTAPAGLNSYCCPLVRLLKWPPGNLCGTKPALSGGNETNAGLGAAHRVLLFLE